MIHKRYKQTERLAAAQALKAQLEEIPVILAEIPLPEIEDMPNHNQILRVKDINVVVSSNYVGLRPQRILIHKTTGKELCLNLFVPEWVITDANVSSHVNGQGERLYYEMEWFDTETGEIATTDMVEVGVDEEGNPILEEQTLPALEDEAFMMPSIPYLMFFTKQVVLPDLIQMFSAQFVSDNWEIWKHADKPE